MQMRRHPAAAACAAALLLGLAAAQIGPGTGEQDGPIEGADKPMYRDPETPIPQLLADACEAGENIRLANWDERPQDLRPFDTSGGVALVVIDLQPLFNDVASPWGGEANNASFWRLLPQAEALAGAVSEYCDPEGRPAGGAIFTQFITADSPGEGNGTWARYYNRSSRWVTVSVLEEQGLDPTVMLAINPELQELADELGDKAYVVNKTTAGAFSSSQFRDALDALGAETLIVMGVETDYCVLATVLPALDAGIRTVVVTDAVASSQPNSGQAVLDYTFRRFNEQLELATTAEVVAALQAAAC